MDRGSARQSLVLAAACTPAVAYLLFVWHYAINAPLSDDWSRAPIVSAALHRHLTIRVVWEQYSEARLVVSNLVLAAFGFINHMNLKAVVTLSALVFVATYVLMLIAFRSYLGRQLTFLPVFSVGIVWFSLVGAINALWAFQLAWYLALLFLFLVIHFLCIWPRNRVLALTLATFAAIAGSLSMLQGFLIWPVGLVCLLWVWTDRRAKYSAVAIWLTSGVLTALIYVHGYRPGVSCVGPASNCSPSANASHPGRLATYFLTLVGNVVWVAVRLSPAYKELVGALLFLAAVAVIVRSLQERSHSGPPLPLLMIMFALLFDLTIALGRAGERLALQHSYYSMPNVLLLAGLVTFAWAHPPRRRATHDRRYYSTVVAFAGLGLAICALSVCSAQYGVRQARVLRAYQVLDARTVVNLDRIPPAQRGCYVSRNVWNSTYGPVLSLAHLRPPLRAAKRNHLMVFESRAFRKYRAAGPPAPPACRARRKRP